MRISAPRILDFDIENRPLSYGGGDWTTADITAIAFSWADNDLVECAQVFDSRTDQDYYEMLLRFRKAYDEADIVTGHYIRNHDLPIINGAMLEFGFPPLDLKMSICTKNDLVKFKDIGKSQEALGAMLKIPAPKQHVGPDEWRRANRLQIPAITRERVVADVVQHKQLRLALHVAGALKSPRVWRPLWGTSRCCLTGFLALAGALKDTGEQDSMS